MHSSLTVCLLVPGLAVAASGQIVFAPPAPVVDLADWTSPGVAGDVDEDGLPDYIVPEGFLAPTFSVLRGAGDGSFTHVGAIPSTPFAETLALIDLDDDGHLDLLARVDPIGTNALVLHRGHGDGGFGLAEPLPSDPGPVALATGDVDGDGRLDLVVIGYGATSTGSARMQVLKGTAQGGFSLWDSGEPLPQLLDVALADFDEDGRLDVVLGLGGGDVHLLQGFGDGTFIPSDTPITVGPVLRALDTADVDDDGHMDIVVSANVQSALGDVPDHVVLLRGHGDGSFSSPHVTQVGRFSTGLALADFDADGMVGAATLDLGDSQLSVLPGDGPNGLGKPLSVSGTGGAFGLAVSDVDQDGFPDALSVDSFAGCCGQLLLVANATYDDDQPWVDLGGAVPGSEGWPILIAEGALMPNTPWELRVSGGPRHGSGLLVLGIQALGAPFKGGLLAPHPDVIVPGIVLDASGAFSVGSIWPAVPGGYSFWLQVWMPDLGAPVSFAATSGLRADVP